MPSTVFEIFAAARLESEGVVRWRAPVPQAAKGVNVVAVTDALDTTDDALVDCPISTEALAELLEVRPELALDSKRPDVAALGERLSAFWLPDEVVIYIGLAGTSLARRIDQYYRTRLGARSPHAGGWFLKSLSVLPELWVHYSSCAEPEGCEDAMLAAFSAGVSEEAAASLHDRDRPIPFANLEWPKRRYKKHGIRGAKEARVKGRGHTRARRATVAQPHLPARSSAGEETRTQRVTESDIRAGRIRIPSGPTKRLLPKERGVVEVELRGERFRARWDPRYGPDRERSGVLGVSHARLARLLRPDEVLSASLAGGVVRLD